jgi:hypothetical protein
MAEEEGMANETIALELDRPTAQAVYDVLYQLGEHFAAGGPVPRIDDSSLPEFHLMAEFMRKLNIALGGDGRIT